MVAWSIEVEKEAERLLAVGASVARAQLGDRIARTFLERDAASDALDFNAHLTTRLRVLARDRGVPSLWIDMP